MKKNFAIIYEDEHLVAVNKNPGIPVIPSRSSEMGISLKYALIDRYGEIFTIHRIDEDTSGLVIFAKTAEIHQKMNTLFSERRIHKKYLLLTRGIPQPEAGEINLPLKKLQNQNKSIVARDGKEAHTHYKVLETFNQISFCEAEILTGRHHQIRVHFKAIHCPLLVDPIYGDNGFYLSEIKGSKYRKSKEEAEQPLLKRLSLHAFSLDFIHPVTGTPVSLQVELPKDMGAVLHQLRKNTK